MEAEGSFRILQPQGIWDESSGESGGGGYISLGGGETVAVWSTENLLQGKARGFGAEPKSHSGTELNRECFTPEDLADPVGVGCQSLDVSRMD